MPKDDVKRVVTEFFKDDLLMYEKMTELAGNGIENFHVWKNQDALWELSYPFRDAEEAAVEPPPKRFA